MLNKRNLIFLSLLILGVFLLTSCLPKPPITEGILKGQVLVPEGTVQTKDLTGQALPDATVNIIDPATGDIIATTTTDADGYYQVFVPAGGPYLLQVVKDGVVILQFTPQVEVGIEYDLGTADCSTTSVALIAQAMLDAEDYPDNLADINLTDIESDPDFNDMMSIVCSTIQAGQDPTASAAIEQAVEDFLNPLTPAPPTTPAPTPVQATPTFDPPAGAVAFPTTVTITSAGADNIYYTTNGSDPTTASTNQATTPLEINSACTVKALAVKASYTNSAIGSAVYTQAATADLTGLALTGSPANYTFAPATYTYNSVTVANAVASITVTPTGAGTITVDGITVTSGNASNPIALTAGVEKTITVVATETGKTAKTYTIKVTRAAPVQATPTFNPPAGAVAFPTTVTITSAGADNIYYTTNGSDPTTASTNQATTPLEINSACTVKALAVKASYTNSAIGSAVYTQAATADLTGLALTGSPANYTFAPATYTYNSVTVANTVASITVTPTGAGTITVDGITVTSGNASNPIALTAGVEKTITVVATETGKTAKTYTIKVTRTALTVGDSYAGGIVAYILQPGESNGVYSYDANVQHGLIAAVADQSTGCAWSNIRDILIGTTGTAIGTGLANTTAIIGQSGHIISAAKVCYDYTNGETGTGVYTDWFMPSLDELYKLLENKVAIGGFVVNEHYWSSSEYNNQKAWYMSNYSPIWWQYEFKNWSNKRVRAVRAF